MHISQCYARGGGQARCGDFCQMLLPRDMSKCHTLKFCILSHFAVLCQKPLLLGNKLLKPNHYDQAEVKDFKGSEWDLHVPSYLKIEHGLPCNKVFCLFRFGLCSSEGYASIVWNIQEFHQAPESLNQCPPLVVSCWTLSKNFHQQSYSPWLNLLLNSQM